MATKQDDMFDLATQPSADNWLATPPIRVPAPITRAEKQSAMVTRRQVQAIKQEAYKAVIGHQAVGAIFHSQYTTMTQLVDSTWAMCRGAKRDPEPQAVLDRYWGRTMGRAGAYLERASEQTIHGINDVLATPTYSEEEPKPPSLLSAIFGPDVW